MIYEGTSMSGKTVKDMATKAGWWEDDSLVVDERITKSFGGNPRIVIKVEDIAENGPDLSEVSA